MPLALERQFDSGHGCLDRLGALVSAVGGSDAWAAPRSLLGAVDACWPDVAWSFSRLTADGFPFELSFAGTAGPGPVPGGFRWTAEVAGPEIGARDRLDRALAWITDNSPATDLRSGPAIEAIRAVQRRGELRWGVWLGGRHRDSQDSYKLYTEVPRDSSSDGLRMIGYDLDRHVLERYYRPGRLTSAGVSALLERAGLADRLDDLLDLVSACTGWPVRPDLPGANFGISLASDTAGQAVGVAVIAFARLVFGVDAVARRGILSLADRFGWELNGYELATRAVEGRYHGPSTHTMVSWTVSPDEAVRTTIGIRPVP